MLLKRTIAGFGLAGLGLAVAFGQQILTMGIWMLMWAVVWLPPLLILIYVKWRSRGAPSRTA